MADSYAETPTGILLIANGFDPMLRWDGLAAQAEEAGVVPPDAAVTLAGSGSGAIVGTYYGYLRYVDKYGNFSNLSPISAALEAQGSTGTITAASDETPIAITSTAHGLSTGDVVKVAGVGGNTAANNTWTITVVDADSFTLDDSSSDGTYTGSGTWVSGIDTVTYTGVEAPTDPKIDKRQILRNTDGQTDTFYVDVETLDLTSTTFASVNTDADLLGNTAQAILDSDGLSLGNSYTVPPNHKAVLVAHHDRMFAAVQRDYTQGSCKVTFGSTTVTGVGTEWMAGLAGRFLYVVGATQEYEIDSVDIVNQTLTLTESYVDGTDPLAVYTIRPAPAEKKLVYYSQAGQYEAWPVTNALAIEEDGDEITGLMSKGSFVYVLERRHTWRLTFESDPARDGAVFLSSIRGCLNHRCWVVIEDAAYMLDEQGAHIFSTSQDSTSISEDIQDLFRPGDIGPHSINWQAAEHFHAVHYRPQQVIRWFVALSGNDLPRHALCYNYRMKGWWIEELSVPVGASCYGHINHVPRVFLGSEARRVLGFWEGFLDGPDAALGTVRGTVTSSTLFSLADSLAAFAEDGLVGSPLAIVAGTGKGQQRQIVSVSGSTLNVNLPWLTLPDTTSVYQIGGIKWSYLPPWFRFAPSEEMPERRVEIVGQPCVNPGTLDLRINYDFSEAAIQWGVSMNSDDGEGVQSTVDGTDLVVNLQKYSGFTQKRMSQGKEYYVDGKRYVRPSLRGFTNNDPIRIFQITIDGVLPGNEPAKGGE